MFRRQRGGNKTYRGIADLLRDKVSTAYCHKTSKDMLRYSGLLVYEVL